MKVMVSVNLNSRKEYDEVLSLLDSYNVGPEVTINDGREVDLEYCDGDRREMESLKLTEYEGPQFVITAEHDKVDELFEKLEGFYSVDEYYEG